MPDVNQETMPCKPTGREMRARALRQLAAAIEAYADAEEVEEVAVMPAAPPIDGALVDKKTAAKALGISTITLDRFVIQGAPVQHVGARRRFDLVALLEWNAKRGRKTSKVKRADAEDTIDVSGIARSGGLRLVGGK